MKNMKIDVNGWRCMCDQRHLHNAHILAENEISIIVKLVHGTVEGKRPKLCYMVGFWLHLGQHSSCFCGVALRF